MFHNRPILHRCESYVQRMITFTFTFYTIYMEFFLMILYVLFLLSLLGSLEFFFNFNVLQRKHIPPNLPGKPLINWITLVFTV